MYEGLENMTVNEDVICSQIITGATDVVFSGLGAKWAFETVHSKRSRLLVMESIRVPERVYLLLKVHVRKSDSSWKTLLNFTQLGCTGVSKLLCRLFQ